MSLSRMGMCIMFGQTAFSNPLRFEKQKHDIDDLLQGVDARDYFSKVLSKAVEDLREYINTSRMDSQERTEFKAKLEALDTLKEQKDCYIQRLHTENETLQDKNTSALAQ
jgi:hypothetical protein